MYKVNVHELIAIGWNHSRILAEAPKKSTILDKIHAGINHVANKAKAVATNVHKKATGFFSKVKSAVGGAAAAAKKALGGWRQQQGTYLCAEA